MDLFLSRLESWTHKLYPKWPRETTLQKIEMLGKKKVVSNTLGTGSKYIIVNEIVATFMIMIKP